MNISLLSLALACACVAVTGCSTTTPHPYQIKSGGFLRPEDYSTLQKTADALKPIPMTKKFPNPTPRWSYYVTDITRFKSIERLAVPNIECSEENDLRHATSIPDAIAKVLVSKKLAKSWTGATSHRSLLWERSHISTRGPGQVALLPAPSALCQHPKA
jgi:hypothetical protein